MELVDFEALPQTSVKVDIHCVTKWSKPDTRWQGVTIERLERLATASRMSCACPFGQ